MTVSSDVASVRQSPQGQPKITSFYTRELCHAELTTATGAAAPVVDLSANLSSTHQTRPSLVAAREASPSPKCPFFSFSRGSVFWNFSLVWFLITWVSTAATVSYVSVLTLAILWHFGRVFAHQLREASVAYDERILELSGKTSGSSKVARAKAKAQLSPVVQGVRFVGRQAQSAKKLVFSGWNSAGGAMPSKFTTMTHASMDLGVLVYQWCMCFVVNCPAFVFQAISLVWTAGFQLLVGIVCTAHSVPRRAWRLAGFGVQYSRRKTKSVMLSTKTVAKQAQVMRRKYAKFACVFLIAVATCAMLSTGGSTTMRSLPTELRPDNYPKVFTQYSPAVGAQSVCNLSECKDSGDLVHFGMDSMAEVHITPFETDIIRWTNRKTTYVIGVGGHRVKCTGTGVMRFDERLRNGKMITREIHNVCHIPSASDRILSTGADERAGWLHHMVAGWIQTPHGQVPAFRHRLFYKHRVVVRHADRHSFIPKEAAHFVSTVDQRLSPTVMSVQTAREGVVELFGGVGAFSHSKASIGLKPVAYVDKCPDAQQHFNSHFPDVPQFQDTTTLGEDFYKVASQAKVLFSGAPCQNFSCARSANLPPHKSADLMLQQLKVVEKTKIPLCIFEQVPEFITFQGGTQFKQFVSQLQCMSYTVDHRAVNARQCGSSQNRSRLIIAATLDDSPCIRQPFVFPQVPNMPLSTINPMSKHLLPVGTDWGTSIYVDKFVSYTPPTVVPGYDGPQPTMQRLKDGVRAFDINKSACTLRAAHDAEFKGQTQAYVDTRSGSPIIRSLKVAEASSIQWTSIC